MRGRLSRCRRRRGEPGGAARSSVGGTGPSQRGLDHLGDRVISECMPGTGHRCHRFNRKIVHCGHDRGHSRGRRSPHLARWKYWRQPVGSTAANDPSRLRGRGTQQFSTVVASAEARYPELAIVTNCTPNHLDWHRSLAHYAAAKQKLLAGQRARDAAVFSTHRRPGRLAIADAWPAPGALERRANWPVDGFRTTSARQRSVPRRRRPRPGAVRRRQSNTAWPNSRTAASFGVRRRGGWSPVF